MKFSNLGKKPLLGAKQNWRHPLSRGLAGHWIANENGGNSLKDIAGTNNGVLTNFNQTASSGWNPGKFGKTLSLDGTDDYLEMGSGSALNPTAISISIWVKANSFTPSYTSLITKRGGSAYHQMLVKSNGKIAMYIGAAADVSYDGTGVFTLSTNVWYHIVLSYDSVSGLKGYVNGILDGSATANGTLTSNNGNTQFGTDSISPGTRNINGLMDDMRIYNRALSQQEVRRLYTTPFADVQVPRESWYNLIATSGNTPFSARAPFIKGLLSTQGLFSIKS